jgi:hypothetical protein
MNRLKDWQEFSTLMERHISNYAEAQYENTDVNIQTSQECITAIKKYTDRYGKNVRGNIEAMRDMFKIAHYAQFAYGKLKEELGGEIYKGGE